ncbi:ABC transporter ATP-binding protein [Clostridium sp. MSJ-11]|uniref:ABC transporter ATP-binding protein n=1 Tax=Clostridium mobile TaxID=2841512 RepID=A0ABS6EGG4_9CLOT|nr:ABC transporter ATP-binding protein [Clostridium mobile]MBU5484309.1 ABC transporter ATP-binding protein [Clostridium mobile]
MKTIIDIRNLSKSFKDKHVLKNINLNFQKGKIYGLIGENGAGKTTLLKSIVGLVKPSSGDILVNGEEINKNSSEYLRDFGVIIENPTFYDDLTVRENLEIYCRYMGYYNFGNIDNILKDFGILEYKDFKAKKLSQGLKQRLGIARAIITKPEVLILDEPINSLDLSSIKYVRDILLNLNKENGTTIIISSHILKEVEALVNQVIFMKEGNVIEEISLNELKNKCAECFYVKVNTPQRALALLERQFGIKNYRLIGEDTIKIKGLNIDSSRIIKDLMDKGVEVKEFKTEKISLEGYYFDIVKRGE